MKTPNELKSEFIRGAKVTQEMMHDLIDLVSSSSAIDISYSDLIEFINNENLAIGAKYLISDFQTTYIQDITGDYLEGFIEPIIVTATSTNNLSPIAYSTVFTSDILYYNCRNDFKLIDDASSAFLLGASKGVIYRRIDTTKNIDICLDFRTIKFRRYGITVPNWSAETNYSKGNSVTFNGSIYFCAKNCYDVAPNDGLKYWVLCDLQSSNPQNSGNMTLGNISPDTENYDDFFILQSYNDSSNVYISITNLAIDVLSATNTVFFNGANNIYISARNRFCNNTFLYETNKLYFSGDNFETNILGYTSDLNCKGYDFQGNISSEIETLITYGSYTYNYIKYIYNLISENEMNSNIFTEITDTKVNGYMSYSSGDSIYDCNINEYFYENFIKNSIDNSTLFAFYNNDILNMFENNNIMSGFSSNTIYDVFNDNKIGENFANNVIQSGFVNNQIKTNFSSNTVSAYFANNYIGNGFSQNNITETSDFQYNTIGKDFVGNTISAGFSHNSLEKALQFSNCIIPIQFNYNEAKNGVLLTSLDFTEATLVSQSYSKTIYSDTTGNKLLYYTDGVLTTANVTD